MSKRNEMGGERRWWGREWFCDFHREGGGVGGGATLHPKIFNIFFSDISLITKNSSSLVSHFHVNSELSM